jgi:nicotinamide-nucleotide amidase
VRGAIADANGAFLARELTSLGVEPVRWLVVGDRPDELEAALREALEADVCITCGGLGPTHDDRTVETLARVTGRALVLDPALETEIEGVARAVAERLGRPYEDLSTGVRKQATLPDGAVSLGLAGTAPAFVLEHVPGRLSVSLPGPPGELRRLWPAVLASPALQALVASAARPEHRVLRFFSVPEAAVADAVEQAGGEGEGLELTVCARNFEIDVDLYVTAGGEERAAALEARLMERFGDAFFARDDRPVAAIVLDRCRELGLTLASAESCTGGLVAALLTEIAGSSDVFLGSVVAYANEVKEEALGVPGATLAAHGAVSAETASAMAAGARERLGADLAISTTGVAGPGGGTAQKPVGLVYTAVSGPMGERVDELRLPGSREEIRLRSAVLSLHSLRRLLAQTAGE